MQIEQGTTQKDFIILDGESGTLYFYRDADTHPHDRDTYSLSLENSYMYGTIKEIRTYLKEVCKELKKME